MVVVDPQGKVLEDFEIEHSALGWKKFRERISALRLDSFCDRDQPRGGGGATLGSGHAGLSRSTPRALKPTARKAPSGVKDDRLDAWSFADALRVDGQNWKALRPEDPLIKELRLLCRDEVGLIEQRTAFINQLRHALAEYYPTALEAFEDWGSMRPGCFYSASRHPSS